MTGLIAAASLWRREVVRFVRQPSRIASAAAMPLLFWLFIGTGLSSSFRLPGGEGEVDFLQYFFPGTVVLLVMFAAIFATISIIEDRHQGFLQGVLVAPVGRAALVFGKVIGGASLALFQGALFLALAPLAGFSLGLVSTLLALGVLSMLAVALTGLGFALAWRIDSTQGYHAVMNIFLVPMWLLSGAFFPATGAPAWLEWVMLLNPLTYGVAALREAMYAGPGIPEDPQWLFSVGVLAVCCVVALVVDLAVARTNSP